MIIFAMSFLLAQYQPPPVMNYQPPPILVDGEAENSYLAACTKAVRLKQKLAVHVGVRRAEIGGLINVRVPSLEGYRGPCVVICAPNGSGWLVEERVVSPTASDREAIGIRLDPRSVPVRQDCPT